MQCTAIVLNIVPLQFKGQGVIVCMCGTALEGF